MRRVGLRWRHALVAAVLATTGCATGPVPPTYTRAELQAQCERQLGWWHAGGLRDGFCEYDSRQ